MAWSNITAERLAAQTGELAIVKGLLLPDGQDADDIIGEEIVSTSKFVRGYCPGSTSLGEGTTIPEELHDAAYAIIRVKIFTRIAQLKKFLTEERTKAKEEALTLLRDWSAGRFKVESPTTAAAT